MEKQGGRVSKAKASPLPAIIKTHSPPAKPPAKEFHASFTDLLASMVQDTAVKITAAPTVPGCMGAVCCCREQSSQGLGMRVAHTSFYGISDSAALLSSRTPLSNRVTHHPVGRHGTKRGTSSRTASCR